LPLVLASAVDAIHAWLHVARCDMLAAMKATAAEEVIVRDLMHDIDRSLLRENLKLTPEQRLVKFASFMRFVGELRRAGENVRRNAKTQTL